MCSLVLVVLQAIIAIINSQTCSNGLTSPVAVTHVAGGSDIEWIELSPNRYAITIVYDVAIKTIANANVEITTRLHNGSLPSPTLRFKRGAQYQITLINNLGPESPFNPSGMNIKKDPNTTNLHTHGLHISGMSPGDNVHMKILPGDQHTYVYNIPCNHSGGTFWYHPHHHGSTEIQAGNGAAGALIIEDDKQAEQLPDWYTNMRELIFFITHMNKRNLNDVHESLIGTDNVTNFDDVWEWRRTARPEATDLYLINGQYQPNICMTAGQWVKLRFAQVEVNNPRQYEIGTGECQVWLLARDGVIIHGKTDTDIPRNVSNIVWLAQPSRADVAVFCPGDPSGTATYNISVNNNNVRTLIATIQVSGTKTVPDITLTKFTPRRPSYLENLLDPFYTGNLPTQMYGNDNYWANLQVTATALGTTPASPFAGETNYLQTIKVNTINTWEVRGGGGAIHPLHIHINHFQILNHTQDVPYGYQEEGDWQDTIYGAGFLRFKTDIWAGTITLHCHILQHEDQGAMGTVLIENGCDNFYNDHNETDSCDYIDVCNAIIPTANPTIAPSTSPTITSTAPTKLPSVSPIPAPTTTPTVTPSKQPTATPTAPTKSPTFDNSPPNFLIIFLDDFLYTSDWAQHSAPAGNAAGGSNIQYLDVPMQNIQSMIDDGGIVFPRTYAGGPKCSPSRYSVLTGRYPSRGHYAIQETLDAGIGYNTTKVDIGNAKIWGNDAIYNVPAILQNNSWYTGAVGKWHLMTDDSGFNCNDLLNNPDSTLYDNCRNYVKQQGFDFVDAFYHANIFQSNVYSHNPEWMVHESIKFMNQSIYQEKKPFYLYFSTTLTHGPKKTTALQNWTYYMTPKGNLTGDDIPSNTGMSNRLKLWNDTVKITGSETSEDNNEVAGKLWVDDAVGALIKYLKNNGVYDNTFIVIMNDHGMGAKGLIYDQGSRIFQFIRYPPLTNANDRNTAYYMPDDFVVSNVDLGATIFELANITAPNNYKMDGKSWLSDVSNELYNNNNGESMSCCNERYVDIMQSHSIFTIDYQYIFRATPETDSGARIYPNATDREQIYNLNTNPTQTHNEISNTSISDIICEFRYKMIDYIDSVACPIDLCVKPDIGQCTRSPTRSPTQSPLPNGQTHNPTKRASLSPSKSPSNAPSKYPSIAPTAESDFSSKTPSSSPSVDTTCDNIVTFRDRTDGVTEQPPDTELESYISDAISEFVAHRNNRNPTCVSNTNYDYMHKPVTYNERRDRVEVNLLICCGDGNLLTDAQILNYEAQDYEYPNGQTFVFQIDSEDVDESATIDIKQIFVFCMITLLIIVCVVIGFKVIYGYRKKRQESQNCTNKNDENVEIEKKSNMNKSQNLQVFNNIEMNNVSIPSISKSTNIIQPSRSVSGNMKENPIEGTIQKQNETRSKDVESPISPLVEFDSLHVYAITQTKNSIR